MLLGSSEVLALFGLGTSLATRMGCDVIMVSTTPFRTWAKLERPKSWLPTISGLKDGPACR